MNIIKRNKSIIIHVVGFLTLLTTLVCSISLLDYMLISDVTLKWKYPEFGIWYIFIETIICLLMLLFYEIYIRQIFIKKILFKLLTYLKESNIFAKSN